MAQVEEVETALSGAVVQNLVGMEPRCCDGGIGLTCLDAYWKEHKEGRG